MKYTADELKKFIDVISSISSIGFSDIIIKNNLIRELNDAKNLIIECSGVNSEDLQLQLVKLYIPMFKSFVSDMDTEISVDKDYINISDGETEVNLVKPDEKLLTCEYLDDSRFDKLKLSTAKEVLSFQIDDNILNKIKTIKDIFSSTLFSLTTNKNGKTSFRIDSWKKTGKSKIKDISGQLPEIELKGNASMFDFTFDDEPVFSVLENDNKQYIAKLSGALQDYSVSLFSILNT